jgi:hypothetical protein
MNGDSEPDELEPGVSRTEIERSVPREWQFSLRGLLITTTVISDGLAIGSYLAGVAFIIFAVVVIEAATLLSVDWLIRPANRQLLAFVTAGSWMLFGSGLAIMAIKFAYELVEFDKPQVMWAAICLLAFTAVCCYGFGWRRWRQLTAYGRANL